MGGRMPEAKRDDAAEARRRRWRRRKIVLGLAALVAAAGLVVFRRPVFRQNFGVVDAGRVYRSAQPGEAVWKAVDGLELGSVLNLRGGSFSDPFYREEVREAGERGIDFYDLPMSATKRPPRRDLLRLIDLFRGCRYPLLIHCKSGADRTGLASALYLMVRRGVGPEEALGAFSLEFGHVPLFGPEHLHEPIEEYGLWLKREGLPHSAGRFRDWVARLYRDPGPGSGSVAPPLRAGPRVPMASRAGVDRGRDQPARAGSQEAASRAGAEAPAPSSVSTTRDATSHSSGISRR